MTKTEKAVTQRTKTAGAGKSSIAVRLPCSQCGAWSSLPTRRELSALRWVAGSVSVALMHHFGPIVLRWTVDQLSRCLTTNDG